MTEADSTRIGCVRHVLGATVTVALDTELAGVAPIYRGQLLAVGQIGSLVRIPQGLVDIIATVSLLGIAELSGPVAPVEEVQRGDRWLQVQLLGEIDRGTGRFERGVSLYPGLDDPVHFATPEQLLSVFPNADEEHIHLGKLSAAEDISVCLDASRLVVRHSAVVGSTGSGKTYAVSSLLQSFVAGGWTASNIVVIDPHGEYTRALEGNASIRSVLDEGDNSLNVPYWAPPAAEIARAFIGSAVGGTFAQRFSETVTNARREFVEAADWLTIDPTSVTADTPVPFDIRPVWYQLDYENNETREVTADPQTAALIEAGNAATLQSAQFEPYQMGGEIPNKGPMYGVHGTSPQLLKLGLQDPRLRFLQQPPFEVGPTDPLVNVLQEWLGGIEPISVLDFSGVPYEAADLAIGVVLNLIFEVALRSQRDGPGIGFPDPVLIVLEEAHRYLGDGANAFTKQTVNRIAREGRKYGIGLMLVSQRPTELPKTALAQCGTIIALRLSNSEDQGAIRSTLPDTISGLASVLPSLRTGEAIVCGEALALPARILIRKPDPEPQSDDPPLDSWRGDPKLPEVANALATWRGTYHDD